MLFVLSEEGGEKSKRAERGKSIHFIKKRCSMAQCCNPMEPVRAGETDLGRREEGWRGCSNPVSLLNPQHGTKPLLANKDERVVPIS